MRLEEVFEHALQIKAQATVSKDLFEIVLYSLGTPFGKEVTQPETVEGGRMRVPCSTMPNVELCLVPALHVYDHDRKIVEYNNLYNDQAAIDQGLQTSPWQSSYWRVFWPPLANGSLNHLSCRIVSDGIRRVQPSILLSSMVAAYAKDAISEMPTDAYRCLQMSHMDLRKPS